MIMSGDESRGGAGGWRDDLLLLFLFSSFQARGGLLLLAFELILDQVLRSLYDMKRHVYPYTTLHYQKECICALSIRIAQT
ncbi:hypothetical protein LX36DRAFT_391682 [Colletotrichum falcatum]|nr:hypothetical protein LX36DRAFT_391682 [Colletotrichum falcatum]